MAFTLKLPAATQSAILVTLVDPVEPLPTLEQLALAAPAPADLAELAEAVGCSFELLDRVDRGRQALPALLVGPIAARLGLQAGEVAAAARAVLDAGRAGALTALPPDRLLGDPIYFRPIAPTVEPSFG